ncbi:MAG: AtpZ/AtpI family protein [Anaerolineae bacterium]|jgi:F0F1-type ATP synthase assembly protein I|nr:AtpZ/AtpI family protein [Anaerolineae bacterium]MDX9831333.1 AtpZ/AtpI family protein [Anaerolineae bacterium]
MSRRDNDESGWLSLWREALLAMSLGWDLAVPIFGGVLLGYFLDRLLQTRYIMTVGLMVLGVGVSYYNLARFIRRMDRADEESEKKLKEKGEQK